MIACIVGSALATKALNMMNERVTRSMCRPARADSTKNEEADGKVRVAPRRKGAVSIPAALKEVLELLGDAPRRRDLLIEHLHKIQDRYGHLSAAHLVALASEMKMAMAEVYEVATFYHHFDVVKEGDTAPPAITVRVCDSIACDLAGSHHLLERLPALLGTDVRVLHAPCVGRCETAPVAVVGQNPIPHATVEQVTAEVKAGHVAHPAADDASTRTRAPSRPATSTTRRIAPAAATRWRPRASRARSRATTSSR